MKRIFKYFIVCAFSLICLNAFSQERSQNGRGWQEKMRSEKIAFLTAEMELTPEEAQVFWPIYNKAQRESFEALRLVMKTYGDLINAVEANQGVDAALFAYAEAQKKSQGIDLKYIPEYKKVISAEKVAKLFLADEKFRRTQIQRLNAPADRRPNPNQNQGRK